MKQIWWMVKAVLMIGCFILAVRYGMTAKENAGTITAFLKAQTLDMKSAGTVCEQEAEREEPVYLCFWGEQKDEPVMCRETGKSSTPTLILTKGNPDLIIPGTGALLWQEKGCFLDTVTADELFGTRQACGQTVWCGDKAYTVCGTFESLRRIIVRQIQEEDGEKLTAVSIHPDGSGNVKGEAKQFLLRYELGGETVDFVFLADLVNDLLLLVPALLMIKFLCALVRCEREAASIYKKIVLILPAAISLFILFWLFRYQFAMPADMIPSKWSDFSFWTTWWKEQRQNIFHIIGTAQGEMQFDTIWNLMKSFLCNAASVFLVLSFEIDTDRRGC